MTQFTTPTRHRSKAVAAWLACLLGVFGAHWWYVGRPKAWMVTAFTVAMLVLTQFYPVWWDNPAFLVLIIPMTDGFIERSEEHTSELQSLIRNSYAVFCLKK